ncbi:MAG: peptide deformylase [Lachnospiraceae bacterium]|nr:peptide deformylase [Lachnospiraceae bacterium]
MAIREVRLQGDPILYKTSIHVTRMTERLGILIDDMFDTMYEEDGVGLAAVQVGILRRLFVADIAEEDQEPNRLVFINPEILETSGSQTGSEGCLSVPGKVANVTRPNYVKIKALDRDMKEFEMEAEGIPARIILHEYDHLDGHLYPEIAEGPLMDIDDVESEEEA